MTRRDWLLVALAHREGRPLTPAQVQKSMFLLAQEAGEHVGPGFYKFIAYNYGPFCREIYDDLDLMSLAGLVTVSSTDSRRVYMATPDGIERGKQLAPQANKPVLLFLKRAVDWVSSKSFPELVRAIYAKYPKYRANSVFVD